MVANAYGGYYSANKDIHLFTKDELIEKFGWEEYLIFALMLGVSAAIGVFFWIKGQKNTADMLLAGRSMNTLPMTMSLIASFMSAITLLGTPAEMYVYGTQYVMLVFSYPFVMAATAYLYLPVFDKLNVSTSYEYLEWRFNKWVRILASACFTLQMVLYMSIVVYTPALALEQLTGFNVDAACAVIFIVCIFYTAVGGIKAVMWTDTFQAAMMFGSFLAVIIKGNYDAGGSHLVFDENYQTGRIELFNFNPDMTVRHTVWSLIIGGYFTWISIYGINQTQVQRYLTVATKAQAIKALWWNMLGIGSLLLMCAYAGLVIFGYYGSVGCDPIDSGLVSKKDQLFPLFVMQVMGDIPCVPGLFVAGVFSGALSTVSSGLNSLAAVTLQDFLLAGCNKEFKGWKGTAITKALAVIYGVISYLVVFLVKYLPGVLEAALGIFGIVGGPVLGAFTLGMFVPWANSIGAFTGTLVSLIFTMWIGFGQTVAKNYKTYSVPEMNRTVENCPSYIYNATDEVSNNTTVDHSGFTHLPLYEISYMWYSAIACMSCIFIGIVVSLLTKRQDITKLNPNLISPGFYSLFDWMGPYAKRYMATVQADLGSNYVPTDRDRKLKSSQIMPSGLNLEDLHKYSNQNPGFVMEETTNSKAKGKFG